MTTNLMAPAVRAARTIGALAAALALALVLAQAAAAEANQTMGERANAHMEVCLKIDGGSFEATWNKEGGIVTSGTLTCTKDGDTIWTCTVTPTGGSCTTPFTPEESPEYPGGGTNKPVWPDEEPRPDGEIVVVGWADPSAPATDQPTIGQDGGTVVLAEDDPAATDPYGTQVDAEEDTEPVTTVEYRRIAGGDEEQP